jgi:hypothetical protein
MKTEVITPTVPNYLQVRIGNTNEPVTVPVKDFTEEELREVGKKYTENLVAKSRRRY